MAHGGARKGAGRKKVERPTNQNVAAKVLAQAKAEQTWLDMIALEKRRLFGAEAGGKVDSGDYQGKYSIIPLTNLLRYLEDRAYGRPVDTVNHLHDKPIEMNLNVSFFEAIERARKRASE